MINWNKYFDHIYCVHYVPMKDRRYDIESELKRVGIYDSGIFSWQLSYDIPKYVERYTNKSVSDLTYNHYLIFNDILFHHYNKVMVIEDDVRFLKDLDRIERLLDECPDYDLCLFDWNRYGNYIGANNTRLDLMEAGKITDHYCYFTHAWLTSCYGITERMAEKIKLDIEKTFGSDHLEGIDHYFQGIALKNMTIRQSYDTIDDFLKAIFDKYKTILCLDRIAIQQQYPDAHNFKMGINELYNLKDLKTMEKDVHIDFNDYRLIIKGPTVNISGSM